MKAAATVQLHYLNIEQRFSIINLVKAFSKKEKCHQPTNNHNFL
jgi:hypothetical protein